MVYVLEVEFEDCNDGGMLGVYSTLDKAKAQAAVDAEDSYDADGDTLVWSERPLDGEILWGEINYIDQGNKLTGSGVWYKVHICEIDKEID